MILIYFLQSLNHRSHHYNNYLIYTDNYLTSDVVMDLGFLLGLGLMGGGYGYEREYNPWAYGMNEKSAAGMYNVFPVPLSYE